MCECLGEIKPERGMKVKGRTFPPKGDRTASRSIVRLPAMACGFEQEHICWDPKDGELCPSRMKPEETLVEVRRGPDVQIGLQTWV